MPKNIITNKFHDETPGRELRVLDKEEVTFVGEMMVKLFVNNLNANGCDEMQTLQRRMTLLISHF